MTNNGFQGGYGQTQQLTQQLPTTMTATKVFGKAGARNYPIPYNSTAILLNDDEDFLWIKSVDATGYIISFREFKLEEVKPPIQQNGEFISRGEFDEWKNRADTQFNQIINSLNVLIGGQNNATASSTLAKSSKPNGTVQ